MTSSTVAINYISNLSYQKVTLIIFLITFYLGGCVITFNRYRCGCGEHNIEASFRALFWIITEPIQYLIDWSKK